MVLQQLNDSHTCILANNLVSEEEVSKAFSFKVNHGMNYSQFCFKPGHVEESSATLR